jgi:hypothetical protein
MKRWLAIALMLIAAGTSSAAAATTTAKYALSNAGWTDLGPGPMLLSFNGPTGVFAISDATPTLKAEGFGKALGGSIKIPTPSHVWGAATGNFGVTAYVAPITGGGGGGGGTSSVWSATDAAASGLTLTNGGLTLSAPAVDSTFVSARNTVSKSSGKVYAELLVTSVNANFQVIGLASSGFNVASYPGTSNYSGGVQPAGLVYTSAGFTPNYNPGLLTPSPNDVYGLAVDFGSGGVWISVNGVWAGGSNPSTGSLPFMSFSPATVGSLFIALSLNKSAGTGVWTLQPTAASQKYAAPAGFTAWDGAGAAGCSQATAYLARATGETAHPADLTTLICGLVADGVWSKLDALYVLAQQTQADAQLNLVSASYPLTGPGRASDRPVPLALTFTPYVGFSGFGVGLDTGLNPTVGTPHYTQTNASLGVWSYSVIDEGKSQIAYNTASYIVNKFGGLFYPRVNDSVTALTVATSITKGLFAVERSDASNMYPYQNGVSAGPLASTPTALSSADFFVGGSIVSGGVTTQTLSAAHIGASLGSAGNLALYTRLRAYMTAVGVP